MGDRNQAASRALHYLRLIFFALLAAVVLLAGLHGSWEAHLKCLGGTFIIDLPVRPVWSPPMVPAYDFFRQTFNELPVKEPANAVALRIFRYDNTLFEFIFYAAVVSAVFGIVYLLIRRGARDVVLHHALFVAIGYVLVMVPCYPLWCWGSGMAFSILGAVFGVFLGWALWTRHVPKVAPLK